MGAEGEFVKKLVPEFEKRNPSVRIDVQMIPWTAAQEKLITAYASDNLPDVFQLGNTWIPQFAALEALEDLNRWMEGSATIQNENYFQGIWDTNIIENRLYGIPWYIDTRVLFYRTDILKKAGFERPPETWKELYNLAKSIRHMAGEEEKYAIYLPTNEWATFVIFGLQNKAVLLTDNNCYANFSSEEFRTAFEFMIKFTWESLSPLGFSQVINVYQAFAEEYFAMYISGPWNIPEFKKWMINDLADKWMTAPLPGPESNLPGVSLAGGSSLVLSRKSLKKSAGWQWIEYLSENESQLQLYRLINDLPAIKSAWQDSLLSKDPYMAAFFEQFHHVVATPKVPEWEQIAFSKIQQYAEIAARRVLPINKVLTDLDKDVNRILEKRRWLLGRDQ